MNLKSETPEPSSEDPSLNDVLGLGRRIEEEYEDYQLMKSALQYDQVGADASLYSQEDHAKISETVDAMESKLLALIHQRRMLASILHHEMPDSGSMKKIEKELLDSMERPESISPYRSRRKVA